MQQALRRSSTPAHGTFAHGPSFKSQCRLSVVVRAKELREFREDSGEVIVPGEQQKKTSEDVLYADQLPPAMRKKDNLSKEMKQRLRQEYYGLGGAENKVSRPSRGMFVVAAGSVLTEDPPTATATSTIPDAVAVPDSLSAELAERVNSAAGASTSGVSSSEPLKKGSSKWVIDENENLKSTMEHRAWTYGCMALMSASIAGAVTDVHSAGDAVTVLGAVFAAYVLSDLGTAVYHWGVDNYGDGNTPVFGRQIAAFQGHHQRPWTITKREFCNNVHQVFQPATTPAAAILAVSPWLPLSLHAFLPSFLFLVCMSQQFHAWSHMKKSELPPAVVALQDANILIGRKAHGAHHKPNFEGNYSIVSGWWNPLLDNSGFFRWLEKVVHAQTGVEPRCWYAPDHEWAEQVQPGQ